MGLKIHQEIPNLLKHLRTKSELKTYNGVNVAHHIPEQAETSRLAATVDRWKRKSSVETYCLGLQFELEPLGAIKHLRIAQSTLKIMKTHK